MNFKIENLSSVKKKITFDIPAERVSSEIDAVYDRIGKNAKLKGFRQGKVPRKVVEKYFSETMREEVAKSLVGDTCYRTLFENKIMPVAAPEIESGAIEPGAGFSYSATVEVAPEIGAVDFKGLEVKKEILSPDAAVIEQRLRSMQENMGQLQEAGPGHTVAVGDMVTIDFTGYMNGETFDKGAAQDFPLEIGSNSMIPGFEDGIVGMQAGEEKTIAVKFPEGYGSAELSGQDAEFRIVVKSVRVKELPELNDDFAKEVGEFETMEQLRGKMAEVHASQETDRIDAELKDRVVQALVEKNPVEVPDAMVRKQLANMLENMKRRLAGQRLSMEMIGMNDEIFFQRYQESAENQVKGMLLLDAVARIENLAVEDADIEAKFGKMSAGDAAARERMQAFYGKNAEAMENLKAMIREEKALDTVIAAARITEVSKEAL